MTSCEDRPTVHHWSHDGTLTVFRGMLGCSAHARRLIHAPPRIQHPSLTNSVWLVTSLHGGLDNVSSGALRPLTSDLNTPRIDSYRFSMANLEGMDRGSQHQSLLQQHRRTHSRSSSEGNRMLKLDSNDTDPLTKSDGDKNHVHMDPKWGIVEHLPDLYMERVYEDHELLVENLMMWTRDSKNKLLFLERPDKTELFSAPESFLLSQSDRSNTDFDDHARAILLEVYYGVGWRKKFKSPTDFCFAIKHPRLQQPKSSKYIKFLCAEDQASLDRWVMGIRLAKHGRQLLDSYRSLVDDLAQEDLDLLAHARSCSVSSIAGGSVSQPAGTPCSHTSSEPDQDQDQLQTSSAVTPTYNHGFHNTVDGLPGPRLRRRDSSRSRASSSSSSGCMSDGGAPSSCCEVAFECDFPTTGTIKRKPSMNPKLPLTSITRQLKELKDFLGGTRFGSDEELKKTVNTWLNELAAEEYNTGILKLVNRYDKCLNVGETVVEGSSPPDTESRSGTLTRNGTRQSRRRSSNLSSEESGSNSSTLKRCHNHHRGSNSGSSSNASTPIRERPLELSPVESPARIPVNEDGGEAFDALPPPPPEMFQSTLSLDSLPPPPPPSELPVYTDLGGSSLSLLSLPPPPSPCIDSATLRKQQNLPPPPHQLNKLPTPQSSTSSTPTNVLSPCTTPTRTRPPCFSPPSSPRASTTPRVPPKPTPVASRQGSLSRQQSQDSGGSSHYAVPPYLAELKAGSPLMARKASITNAEMYASGSSPKSPNSPATPSPPQSAVAPKSPILLTKQRTRTATKKISFNFTPEEIGGGSSGATTPSSPTYGSNKKPLPPKRSESTRLSTTPSPKRLSDADSTLTPPPKDFLKDLQRIMRKKWQVAQKCKLDSSTTPHEVLGFRDPPPPVADYRETNVSNWVQEHYGTRDNLYENVYLVGGNPSVQEVTYASRSQTVPSSVDYYSRQQANSVAMAIANKKRPPPPPQSAARPRSCPRRGCTDSTSSASHSHADNTT
ncbi:hypothetical protein ANN_16142 [Periplaneta americana]|uniref:Ras-associating domain-containing protein n=1 Tax=Periplaneta americana TaxID=6978 RepID=A0ABQ8SK38_PERAM|nr:hypothetical protein ANN_16142 [Periplaneta americana]